MIKSGQSCNRWKPGSASGFLGLLFILFWPFYSEADEYRIAFIVNANKRYKEKIEKIIINGNNGISTCSNDKVTACRTILYENLDSISYIFLGDLSSDKFIKNDKSWNHSKNKNRKLILKSLNADFLVYGELSEFKVKRRRWSEFVVSIFNRMGDKIVTIKYRNRSRKILRMISDELRKDIQSTLDKVIKKEPVNLSFNLKFPSIDIEIIQPLKKDYDFFNIFLGIGIFSRFYNYSEAEGKFASHNLPGAPVILLSGSWYPGAQFGWDNFQHLGINSNFNAAFVQQTSSSGRDGASTSMLGYSVFLTYRFIVEKILLNIFIKSGVSYQKYAISEVKVEPQEDIPNVDYISLFIGTDFEFTPYDHLQINLGADILPVVASGEIEASYFFPNNKTLGVRLNLALSYEIYDKFKIKSILDWQRFINSIDFEEGDQSAELAIDDMLTAVLGVAYNL